MDPVALYESQEPDDDITTTAAQDALDDDIEPTQKQSSDDETCQPTQKLASDDETVKAPSDACSETQFCHVLSPPRSVSPITPKTEHFSDAQPSAHGQVQEHRVINFDMDVDALPPREGRRFTGQIPEPRKPKGVKGWTFGMLQESIVRCGLSGRWQQGGQLERGVYIGDSPHGNYLINWHAKKGGSGTWWCQGKAAMNIHMQILASMEAARQDGAGTP